MTTTRLRGTPYWRTASIVLSVVAGMFLLVVAEALAQPASLWESRMLAAEIAVQEGRLADAEVALREGVADAERTDDYTRGKLTRRR